MNWIDKKLKGRSSLIGFWLSTGSEIITEMAGLAGFDWVLIDMEHGTGNFSSLLHQVQAISATNSALIVRVPCNSPEYICRALDYGASGIMIPRVNNAEQAACAVSAMRYEPEGIRGMSSSVRAGGFGFEYDEYYRRQSFNLVTIVQIETLQAVESAESIAAVNGVDVLFIGPSDLTHNMGITRQYTHRDFVRACSIVVNACKNHGKLAGILMRDHSLAEKALKEGFSFVAAGSDIGILSSGMKAIMNAFRKGERQP